jgi:hypothetical protein
MVKMIKEELQENQPLLGANAPLMRDEDAARPDFAGNPCQGGLGIAAAPIEAAGVPEDQVKTTR